MLSVTGGSHRVLLGPLLEVGHVAARVAGALKQRARLVREDGPAARGGAERLRDLLRRREDLGSEADAADLGRRCLDQLLHQRGERPIDCGGVTLDLLEEGRRQRREPRAQRQEDATRRLGVGAGAVPHREVDLEALGNAAQAEVGQAGQHELGELKGVEGGSRRPDAGPLEEGDVEADAVADDRAVADELGQLAGEGAEARR